MTPLGTGFGGTGTSTTFTAGSLVFAGVSGVYSQDNSKLFWDDTNFRLGVGGAIVPSNTLTVQGSSYLNGATSIIGALAAASTIQFSTLTTGVLVSGVTGLITSSSTLSPTLGGTGVANAGGSTLTLGGEMTTSGKFDFLGGFDSIFRVTGLTDVTFPTSGTLLSSTGGGFVSSIAGTANQITASASTGAVTLSIPSQLKVGSIAVDANAGLTLTGGIVANNNSNNTTSGFAYSFGGTMPGQSFSQPTFFLIDPTISTTINTTEAAALEISPTFSPATATTITKAVGVRIDAGTGAGAGAVTTAVGLSVVAPGFGSSRIVAEFLGITNFGNSSQSGFSTTGVLSLGTPLTLTNGGSSANLTASNGGIVYSTASALAILAGTVTAGQVLVSGSSSAPSWSSLSGIAVTSVSGTTNRLTASPTTGAVVIDISASYVGQNSITTLGTITTGVWNGTLITGQYGGTGVNNSGLTINLGSGSAVKLMQSDGSGNATWTSTPSAALYQTFINASNTSGSDTGNVGIYIRNSNTTVNNWMTHAFLNAGGNVISLIGTQITDQTGTTQCDMAIFAKSLAGVPTEGFRLVGATNTLALANPLPAASGGTANGFTAFTGPTTSTKTFTLPNASATILTNNAAVTPAQGGTGISSYAIGDILYASASTTLSKLADVATGNALISGGVTTAPLWGKIGLTTHVTGVLPYANGGTNASTSWTQGSIIFAGSTTLSQDNANFFWDGTNHFLGLKTASPLFVLDARNATATVPIASIGKWTGNGGVPTAFGTPYLKIGGNEFGNGGLYTIGFAFQTASTDNPAIEIGAITTLSTGARGLYDFVIATSSVNSLSSAAVERFRITNAGLMQLGTPSFSANGAVLTVLGGIGPTGARTTVQKWLTINDSSGNPFYIPCF